MTVDKKSSNIKALFKSQVIFIILLGIFGLWYSEQEFSRLIEDRDLMIEYAEIEIGLMESRGESQIEILTKRKNLNNYKFDNSYYRSDLRYLSPIAYSMAVGSIFGFIVFWLSLSWSVSHFTRRFEIILLLVCVIFGIIWVRDPSGSYEPIIALCGIIIAALEAIRRKNNETSIGEDKEIGTSSNENSAEKVED
jgi:hypothetical protein